MSAVTPIADIGRVGWHVRATPEKRMGYATFSVK